MRVFLWVAWAWAWRSERNSLDSRFFGFVRIFWIWFVDIAERAKPTLKLLDFFFFKFWVCSNSCRFGLFLFYDLYSVKQRMYIIRPDQFSWEGCIRMSKCMLFVRYPDNESLCCKKIHLLFEIFFPQTVIFKFSLGFLWPDLVEPTGFASFRFVCKFFVC